MSLTIFDGGWAIDLQTYREAIGYSEMTHTTPMMPALLSPVRTLKRPTRIHSDDSCDISRRSNFHLYCSRRMLVDGDSGGERDSVFDVNGDVNMKSLTSSASDSDFLLLPTDRVGGRPRCNSESRLADVAYDCYLSKSCVFLLHHPSVFSLCRLRKKLGSSDKRWMEDFLENGGLELLFECLGTLGGPGGGFHELVMRLECILCIRTCFNSFIGLQCVVSSGTYAPKFAVGMFCSFGFISLYFFYQFQCQPSSVCVRETLFDTYAHDFTGRNLHESEDYYIY